MTTNNRDLQTIIRNCRIIQVTYRGDNLCEILPIEPALQNFPTVRVENLQEELNRLHDVTQQELAPNIFRITLYQERNNESSFYKILVGIAIGLLGGAVVFGKPRN
jgi:hypothetical protein